MVMVPEKLKDAIETRIYNALAKEFAEEGKTNKEAKKAWKRQAKVMSEIALDIVDFLMNDVQVAAGIPTAGSAAAQSTVAPGKLM
jgi:hypothetical protein